MKWQNYDFEGRTLCLQSGANDTVTQILAMILLQKSGFATFFVKK
jgi:hypothetical protein